MLADGKTYGMTKKLFMNENVLESLTSPADSASDIMSISVTPTTENMTVFVSAMRKYSF